MDHLCQTKSLVRLGKMTSPLYQNHLMHPKYLGPLLPFEIASDNRKFQERMTKNRYQYQMADMKKAGLNPILASGQAPPGAPPGAMASIPDFGKSFSGGYSAKAGADLANQQAQTELDKQSLLGMQEALTANQAKNSAWMAKLAQLAEKGIK